MPRKDMDILAAEYALGTLDAAEHTEAERLRASDRTFAYHVEQWERRLSSLGEAEKGHAPPASLWRKIESVLPAGENALSAFADQIAEMKRSLAVWRYATVGAVAAAVALALVWIGGIQSPFNPAPPPAERYVAMLQSKNGETGFVVTMEMGQKQFAIRPVSAKTPPSMSYELWCIMPGKKGAMTVGLVGTEAYAMMGAPAELSREELEKGVQLAISLEPKGGAPEGRSMGPIMFAGLLVKQTP